MDAEKHRLDESPRSLTTDAFFEADRSSASSIRKVQQIELDEKGRDRVGAIPVLVSFSVFQNRHLVDILEDQNPLPHAQKKTPKDKLPDPTIAKWKHNATYTCFFSQKARALSANSVEQPRLQVKLLFGTGSEYYRHGVCGAVENATQPTLLIVITGVEPTYELEFWNPDRPFETRTLLANNRWGVGITTATIEKAIVRRYGRVINYDISVCAAFSTGYAGLQGVLSNRLFPLDRLERLVFFDCLYGSLKPVLDRVKSMKGHVHIVAYIVTGGGNSFHKDKPITFDNLTLGRIPGWNYINLMGNIGFHAVTSARLVNEARTSTARILTSLPAGYEKALNKLISKIPIRNSMVSDATIFRKVRGGSAAGAINLATFMSDKEGVNAVQEFFRYVTTTRHCIGRAQLLGWPAPAGEEWHDMLLVEFAWEYLT